jgi:hypothetical protein
MTRIRPSSLCFSASFAALLLAALALSGCESGPVTAYDTLPSQPVTFEFGKLMFASALTSGLANTCLGPFITQIEDSEGNPLANSSEEAISVSLTDSSNSASFFSDNACLDSFDPISPGPSIPVGASSVTFYLVFPSPVSDVAISATAVGDFSEDNEKTSVTLNVN